MSEINKSGSPKIIVLSLLLIFTVPMILAGYFYQQHYETKTVNYGQLLTPVKPLSLLLPQADQYQGRWILLYVSANCDKLCTQNLYNMRQVRLAVGKDMDRVDRMLVTSAPFVLPAPYQGTLQQVIPDTALQKFLQHNQKGLYLVDPLGNIILHYPPSPDPRKMLKDITRLLRISQIG